MYTNKILLNIFLHGLISDAKCIFMYKYICIIYARMYVYLYKYVTKFNNTQVSNGRIPNLIKNDSDK